MAVYLLHGYEAGLPQCLSAKLGALGNLEPEARILRGIQELDAAIANPAGIEQPVDKLLFEKAGAYIDLAHTNIAAGDLHAADISFKNAVHVYQSIVLRQTESLQDGDLVDRISSGLIRAGDPLAALDRLRNLPPANSGRLYLTAEALFALQSRADAANSYESWIKGGCESRPYMITDDEYGEKWSLLLSSRPLKQTKCEQLPQELRLRMETLNHQFGHPNNIPAHSYPATLFRSLQDF